MRRARPLLAIGWMLLVIGVVPFLIGDALKIVVAVVLSLRIRRRTLALL